MSSGFAEILKDVVCTINRGFYAATYDFPYALTPKELEELIEIVDNAPVAYSLSFFDPAPLTYKSTHQVFAFTLVDLEADDDD